MEDDVMARARAKKTRAKRTAAAKRSPARKPARRKAKPAKRAVGATAKRAVGKTAKRAVGKTAKRAVSKTAKRTAGTPVRRGSAAAPGAAMRALAQRIIDVTLANDDEAAFALYAPDVESSEASGPPTVGIDALRGKYAGWRQMVTDTSFEPRRVVVDGNVIVIEWVGRVTLRASGRQAELHEVAVHEIRDGKIAREAFFYNPAALAPEPAIQ
jgi:ketosteroid isomerase-like protein